MAQWGNTDDAANSVLWGVSQLNKTANLNNQTLLFGNTTPSGFVTGRTDGQFALDGTEIAVTANASVLSYEVTFAGSGYSANAVVTVGGNATANATANSIGRISAVNLVLAGNSYVSTPTVTVAAPTAKSFNAASAVAANGEITISGAGVFRVNDRVTYTVASGNTAIAELTSGSNYYIVEANATVVYLGATAGGSKITLTDGPSETGHSLTGQTATATAVISNARGAAHAGWVVRTVGSGGRAGRVQYEVLVAMNSFTSDSEDTVLKDV